MQITYDRYVKLRNAILQASGIGADKYNAEELIHYIDLLHERQNDIVNAAHKYAIDLMLEYQKSPAKVEFNDSGLKHCPFCYSLDVKVTTCFDSALDPIYVVKCQKCRACTDTAKTIDDSKQLWNERKRKC